MSEYKSTLGSFSGSYWGILESCKMQSEHPYNDGWTQRHYKKQYEELLNLGEKQFTKNVLNEKIQSLEGRISELTIELNDVKSKLSVIN